MKNKLLPYLPTLLLFAALVAVNAALSIIDRARKPGSADAGRARAGLPDHFMPRIMLGAALFAFAGTLVVAFLPIGASLVLLLPSLAAAVGAIVLHEICWIRSGQEIPLS